MSPKQVKEHIEKTGTFPQTEIITEGRLNEVIHIESIRPNKSLRIQRDFQFCPTMTEQHSAQLTDINYLMKKYQPDELAQYLIARNQHRQEITNHDFSQEYELSEASNEAYKLKQAYNDLKPEIRDNFKNHVEFLKFIDNPSNQEKMIKLGLMTKKEIAEHTVTTPAPTQEKPKEEPK